MANVDSDKPMLRGLTPPVLPQFAQRPGPDEATLGGQAGRENPPKAEAFPGELTPVVTVDESMSLAAEAEQVNAREPETPTQHLHEDPTVLSPEQALETEPVALEVLAPEPEATLAVAAPVVAASGSEDNPQPSSQNISAEDHTEICQTPIPPDGDDQTVPTADPQILPSATAILAVPARAISLGMANIVSRPPSPAWLHRTLKLARKPISLSGLQLAALVVGAAVVGGLVTSATGPRHEVTAHAEPTAPAAIASAPAKPQQATANLPPPVAASTVAAAPAAGSNKPRIRKKKPAKKFAKTRAAAHPKATR